LVSEADTVDLLVGLLEKREPFLHVRFGDGDVMFATGVGSKITGDGEEWSPGLQNAMILAWFALVRAKTTLLVGDIETYDVSDGIEAEWRILRQAGEWLRGEPITAVHIEALRCSRPYAGLVYEAIRNDPRRKIYAAPYRLKPAADWLGAEHVPVPLRVAHEDAHLVVSQVVVQKPDVLLVSAGRGGKLIQSFVGEALPHITQIDIGSGLDMLIPDGVRRGTDGRVDRQKVLAAYRDIGWPT
jgi:hypothetical protein